MATKRLSDIETKEVQLEVYQCHCGFNIGFDATFIEQVSSVYVNCPNCGLRIESDEED